MKREMQTRYLVLSVAAALSFDPAPTLAVTSVQPTPDWLALASRHIGLYRVASDSDSTWHVTCELDSAITGAPPTQRRLHFIPMDSVAIGEEVLVFELGGGPDWFSFGDTFPPNYDWSLLLREEPTSSTQKLATMEFGVISGRAAILSALGAAIKRTRAEFDSTREIWGFRRVAPFRSPADTAFWAGSDVQLIYPPYAQLQAEVQSALEPSSGKERVWALCVLKRCYDLQNEIPYLRSLLGDPYGSQYAYDRLRQLGIEVSKPDGVVDRRLDLDDSECDYWTYKVRPAF